MAGDDRVCKLGEDGVVITDDALEQGLSAAQAGQKVPPHLLLDRLVAVAAVAKLTNGSWLGWSHTCTIDKSRRRFVSDLR